MKNLAKDIDNKIWDSLRYSVYDSVRDSVDSSVWVCFIMHPNIGFL
jgi:hypothetical protein